MARFAILLLGAALGLLAPGPARAKMANCATADAGIPCTCDLRHLHPLQGGIGLSQVAYNIRQIKKDPAKARRKLLADPIRVVRAPDGGLYVTDHHHGARAWLDYQTRRKGGTASICQIEPLPPAADMDQFVQVLQAQKLVHLEDAQGRPMAFQDLPRTLAAMPDDPYRTLAGLTRLHGAWCRYSGRVEFAEFAWADYLRPRLPVTSDNVEKHKTLAEAEQISRAPEARCVPGYLGAADGAVCAKTAPAPDPSCPAR